MINNSNTRVSIFLNIGQLHPKAGDLVSLLRKEPISVRGKRPITLFYSKQITEHVCKLVYFTIQCPFFPSLFFWQNSQTVRPLNTLQLLYQDF